MAGGNPFPEGGGRGGAEDFDLVIVGGGSAGFAAAIRAHELGARVAIVNDGLIGGTCVNVGCVPSKALIGAAEALHRPRRVPFAGIAAESRLADFGALMRQKDELLAELRRSKYEEVLAGLPRATYVPGHARLADRRTVAVGDLAGGERRLRAGRILLATGASPAIPPIPGLADAGYLTSATALSLRALPESLLVLGGGYIAAELGQAFARLGSRVAILERGERLLRREGRAVAEALTTYLRAEGIAIHTGVAVRAVRRAGDRVHVEAEAEGRAVTFSASHLLVAAGRRPNTDGLGLEEVGVERTPEGGVAVDEHLETAVEGVFAAGDAIRPFFVYAAAYEGALAAENALGNRKRARDYAGLPWVIFTDPQVGGVGQEEEEARAAGLDAEGVTLPLDLVPRSLVSRDTRGFIRLIRDRATDRLVGARILAAGGGELVAEASLAIKQGIPVAELAAAFHPYLTLSEGIKLAALQFRKDVSKLSCCAG